MWFVSLIAYIPHSFLTPFSLIYSLTHSLTHSLTLPVYISAPRSEKTSALSVLPKIKEVAAWDGKDAPEELISAEEYSLEDLMGDDEEL